MRLELSTPISPPEIVEYDVAARAARRVWAQPPPRGFEPSRYACGRLWATVADGARVPMSVLYRRGGGGGGGGGGGDDGGGGGGGDGVSSSAAVSARPALLYGYGAYGECSDPSWCPERLAMVDSGMLHAIAHVRGGGERGAAWHAAGARARKPNSFGDLVACAEELARSGLAEPGAIALEGRSAGGLLVGAAANTAPQLFRAVLASVPFLDAAGTLQDASLPLTANEWEEFGNPNEVAAHQTVLGFSPVHNVPRGGAYPRCLLLPALNDARTGFWEALKFADAVRGGSGGAGAQREVLVSTDLYGGHFRAGNPQQRAEQRAFELGFVLDALEVEVEEEDRDDAAPDT